MPKSKFQSRRIDRREFLALGAAGLGGLVVSPVIARELGDGRRPYGERSPFEHAARSFGTSVTPGTGSSRTPLHDLYGTITPSSLHFERHHSGVPKIDPNAHELLLDGLVERPLVFTLNELRRFPSVARVHFVECAGNSGREHEGRPGETAQKSHGLLSNTEWTGVLLKTVLDEAGLKPAARWIVAEGADASRLSRSLPLDKAVDDVLVAYGQNGEALRPEQGYPLRLIVRSPDYRAIVSSRSSSSFPAFAKFMMHCRNFSHCFFPITSPPSAVNFTAISSSVIGSRGSPFGTSTRVESFSSVRIGNTPG